MSIFRPEVPKTEKEFKPHPWARSIKDIYSNSFKHAHNSVRNPKYPSKKEKQPDSDRAKFTVIGDRVTKEFIYCTNLVKGLHKYRWRNFDAPVIIGCTTVEWPAIWNDLKIRYGGLTFCLKSSVAVLLNDKIVGGEKELKQLVETKYIYHLCLDYYNQGVAEFAKFVRSSGRPCAYMHIAIDNEHIGTMIFMLYSDQVPYTCENFLRLCKEKRGGYAGTPVHRIVKDGWIQCGGFALKNTPLDCENYIIPPDKRGVLCMANDGKHIDCSTQFFVLLQPAPWMAHKYVAFGQLIEGENTLKKIESVKTWYESPTSQIIIYRCGIFNMECQDIMINRGANAYISGHVKDLNALGEMLWENLLEKTFLEAQLRELELFREQDGEGAEGGAEETDAGIRTTQRFNCKKEDIQTQLANDSRRPTLVSDEGNNDFDVEEYEYEPEEDVYKHRSLHTPSLVVKPERPFYIPLTDVPYPGEIDSDFNLRRFLQGDYCLESDLQYNAPKKVIYKENITFSSELFVMPDSESSSQDSFNSDDQKEINKYLKLNVDRFSFAGGIIKHIARGNGKFNIFEDRRRSELITDEGLRRFRKVRIAPPAMRTSTSRPARRETGLAGRQDAHDSSTESRKPSVLARLYDEVAIGTEQGPTLKDYKPIGEIQQKNILLTYSVNFNKSNESTREKYRHHSLTIKDGSFEQVLYHRNKAVRKISSDYVKTIDQIQNKLENSIRSVEFAKKRPTITVSEYQTKNKIYQEGLKKMSFVETVMEPAKNFDKQPSVGGIRLPGDTPLYSVTDIKVASTTNANFKYTLFICG